MSGPVEQARPNRVGLAIVELWLWGALIGLTFLASIKNMVLMGLIFFVAPGLILLAAPNVLLLAVLFQVPRLVRALTRSWSLAALAAVLTVAAACAPAWIVDRKLEAEASAAQASDFGDLAARRDVKVLGLVTPGATTCSSDCNNMLTEGRVPAIAVPVSAADGFSGGLAGPVRLYRRGDLAACEAAAGAPAPYNGFSRGCIIAEPASAATVDAILVQTPMVEATAEARESGPRFNPFHPGSLKVERLDLWTCAGGRCVNAARRTHVLQQRPFPFPLIGGSGPMMQELALARSQWEANPIDIPVLVGQWAGLPAPAPGAGRIRSFLPGVESLSAVAPEHGAVSSDPEAVERTLQSLEQQQTPLTSSQIEAVDRLLAASKPPRRSRFGFDWARHPEALVLVESELGPALLDENARSAAVSVEHAIAQLPPRSLRKVAPQVLTRLEQPGWLKDRPHDLGFVIRLSEFGPQVAAPIGAALKPGDPHILTVGPSMEMAEALSMALCRLGPEAKAAEPDLRAAYERSAKYSGGPGPLYQLTLARMEGRAPRSACFGALPPHLIYDKGWVAALRAREPDGP